MRPACALALLLSLCVLVQPRFAVASPGKGPLYVRSQNPGQAFRLASLPHDARGLPQGLRTVALTNSTSNIWGQSDSEGYLLDFHMNDLGVLYAQGMAERLTLGGAITERRIVNAHLDQLVNDFHELVNISPNGRDEVPKNDLRIRIDRYNLDLRKPRLTNQLISRSAEAFLVWNWVDGGPAGASVASFAHLRHELSEEALVTEDSTDTALGMALTVPQGNNLFYANLSWTRLGKTEQALIPIKEDLFSGMLSWERVLSPRTSFYLQYLVDSQIFRDELGDLSKTAHQLQFGWKWQHKALTWQLALVENFIRFSNSPDVSLSLGLRYDFPRL